MVVVVIDEMWKEKEMDIMVVVEILDASGDTMVEIIIARGIVVVIETAIEIVIGPETIIIEMIVVVGIMSIPFRSGVMVDWATMNGHPIIGPMRKFRGREIVAWEGAEGGDALRI